MSGGEPVGTLAEEAARLFAALQAWAGDSVAAAPEENAAPTDAEAGAERALGADHETHGGAECRWCPVCRVVRVATSASPEVRAHLSQAALSLALAVKGLLEEPEATARRAAPVEKIDLTEE